jgi:hypothetical protein
MLRDKITFPEQNVSACDLHHQQGQSIFWLNVQVAAQFNSLVQKSLWHNLLQSLSAFRAILVFLGL